MKNKKIGIMGAMLEEIASIKAHMKVTDEVTIAGRTFYCGSINETQVVLVFSRWGKTAAASTCTKLINVFNVESIIFSGVAGAVAKELNIGDIVIADSLYHHDMDARPLFNRFQTPLTGITHFDTDSDLQGKAFQASSTFVENIENYMTTQTLCEFDISQPQVYLGSIASGDRFVQDALENDAFILDDRKVLAVEMEGAAVAQVCHEHLIPFCVIRTISDKADHSATIDFQTFIITIASQYAWGIINGMLS